MVTALNLTLIALLVIFGLLTINTVRAEHNHITEHLDRIAHHLKEVIRMSAQDSINAVVTQLGKAKGEIVAKIADLQAQIDAGVPAEQLDLTALTEAAQALDDVVADAPAEPADVPVDAPEEVPAEDPADPPF
jgi:DNA-directed RNA polymerase subunit F